MLTVAQLPKVEMHTEQTDPITGEKYVMVHNVPFLYCPRCGGEYSANPGDYWAADPNAPLTCSNGHRKAPMRLVKRETTLIEVEPLPAPARMK